MYVYIERDMYTCNYVTDTRGPCFLQLILPKYKTNMYIFFIYMHIYIYIYVYIYIYIYL